MIRVLDKYVLVEQTVVKKNSRIILDNAKDDKDKFDYSFVIKSKGSNCERDINIGDSPVFGEFVRFNGMCNIWKDDKGNMINHLIVHENDIIAIDNDSPKISLPEEVLNSIPTQNPDLSV